jgi:hypothetical protein
MTNTTNISWDMTPFIVVEIYRREERIYDFIVCSFLLVLLARISILKLEVICLTETPIRSYRTICSRITRDTALKTHKNIELLGRKILSHKRLLVRKRKERSSCMFTFSILLLIDHVFKVINLFLHHSIIFLHKVLENVSGNLV